MTNIVIQVFISEISFTHTTCGDHHVLQKQNKQIQKHFIGSLMFYKTEFQRKISDKINRKIFRKHWRLCMREF